MLQWRVYYADGTTFDSSQGEPRASPAYGVVLIAQIGAGGSGELVSGSDYYIHEGGFWIGPDLNGIVERLAHRVPADSLLIGRLVSPALWIEIRQRALNDDEFFAGRPR